MNRAWSLMTKTRGGVVSVLRDLTLEECRRTYHRLNPEFGQVYTSYEENRGASSFGGRLMTDSEMEVREVFGPEGWNSSEVRSWDAPWPKHVFIRLDDPLHFARRTKSPA